MYLHVGLFCHGDFPVLRRKDQTVAAGRRTYLPGQYL